MKNCWLALTVCFGEHRYTVSVIFWGPGVFALPASKWLGNGGVYCNFGPLFFFVEPR